MLGKPKESDLMGAQGELATCDFGGLPQQYDPDRGAKTIKALGAKVEYLRFIEDMSEAVRTAEHYVGEIIRFLAWWESEGRKRGRPTKNITDLLQLPVGVSPMQVSRWRKRFLDKQGVPLTGLAFDEAVAKVAKAAHKKIVGDPEAIYSSESNEWYTPEKYIDYTKDVLGEIDLDPASSDKANEVVCAKEIFTERENALTKQWYGKVFLNPPYGTKDGESMAGMFCQKAIAEYESGRVEECIILVNSVHSQKWQSPLYKFPVCFVDHRIQFQAGDGSENKNPTFQNIFVYLGKNVNAFADAFKNLGHVMVPYV